MWILLLIPCREWSHCRQLCQVLILCCHSNRKIITKLMYPEQIFQSMDDINQVIDDNELTVTAWKQRTVSLIQPLLSLKCLVSWNDNQKIVYHYTNINLKHIVSAMMVLLQHSFIIHDRKTHVYFLFAVLLP